MGLIKWKILVSDCGKEQDAERGILIQYTIQQNLVWIQMDHFGRSTSNKGVNLNELVKKYYRVLIVVFFFLC